MDALPAVRWNIPHVWNRGILPEGSRLLRKQWDFELVAEEPDIFEFTGCLVPEEEHRAIRGLDGTNISCENSNCGMTPLAKIRSPQQLAVAVLAIQKGGKRAIQLAFYFNQTRCIGCYTCVVACKDWHDVPAGPASWRRVITIEWGKYPEPFVAFLSSSCYHCAEPACIPACPVNAISKREEDGVVVVDSEACLGKDSCGLCLEACPYEAPQFGAEENAKVQMCDFCLDRWAEGKQPICVAGCPTRALDAGSIDEMKARYGEVGEAVGFSYDEKLRPSVIFKPKAEVFRP